MSLDAWLYNDDDPTDGYTELIGDCREVNPGNATWETTQQTRKFKLRGARLNAFLDDLLGYSSIAAGRIERVFPDMHPDYGNLYAQEAQWFGFGGDQGGVLAPTYGDGEADASKQIARMPYANVTATYRPVDFRLLTDSDILAEYEVPESQSSSATTIILPQEWRRYCTFRFTYNGEFITTSKTARYLHKGDLSSPGPAVPSGVGKSLSSAQLTITWREVPHLGGSLFVPPITERYQTYLAKVNSTDFLDMPFWPRGTVLFLGMEPVLKAPRLNGDYTWDINLTFLIRRNGTWSSPQGDTTEAAGHNMFWNMDLADADYNPWDLVTNTGLVAGRRVYEYGELNNLFFLDGFTAIPE